MATSESLQVTVMNSVKGAGHGLIKVPVDNLRPNACLHSGSSGAAPTLGCGNLRKRWHRRVHKQMRILEEEST